MSAPKKCCDSSCCPNLTQRDGVPQGFWAQNFEKLSSEPCCKCKVTEEVCINRDPNYPHVDPNGRCMCVCDPNRILKKMAGINSCLKPANPIGYRCPYDKPVWKEEECKCVCDKSPGDCLPHQTFRADFCRCICEKDLIVCDKGDPCSSAPFSENPTPNYHPEDCSCKCDLDTANGGPGCTGNQRKPQFNSAKCECECKYDVGPDKCPERYPYIMKDRCDCECPDSISGSCLSHEIFDADTCECIPCDPCEGGNTRKPKDSSSNSVCDCECLIKESDCPESEPSLNTEDCECYCPESVAAECTGPGESFNSSNCSCEYDVNNLSILLEP